MRAPIGRCLPAVVATVVACLGLAPPRWAGAQEARFEDTTSVFVVEVPVNVVRDGATVRGLTAENFEILEGETVRQILDFSVVDLATVQSVSPAPAAVPLPARRHFLLFFDLSFTDRKSLARSVEGARDLLESGLHASDLVGVGIYGLSTGASLLLNFTPDHTQARRVLEALQRLVDRDKAPEESAAREDPLLLTALSAPRLQRTIGVAAGEIRSAAGEHLAGPGVESGGRGDIIMEVLYGMKAQTESHLGEHRRGQIGSLSDSLTALARATARIDGRKFLVLFSQGFDERFLYEEGGAQTLGDLQEIVDAYRRAGWAIQSIDPTGIGGSEEDGTDALLVIARETGGELYRNFNRLDQAMEQMLDRTSVTYLLAFQAEPPRLDGAFHPIRVRLVGVPGARALHRAGYVADPLSEAADLSRLEIAHLLLGDEERHEIETAALTLAFPGGAARTAVSVVLRLEGADLVGAGKNEIGAEIYGYALGRDREVHDFFGQSLTFERKKELAGRPLKVFSRLDLVPGRYTLRLLVRRPWDGRFTARSLDLEVPDLTTSGPILSTPVFAATESGPVVFIRRDPAAANDYPYLIGDRTFVPAVAPALDASASASLLVTAYGLDLERHLLGARLVRADGEGFGGERLALQRSEPAEGPNASRLYFALDPTGLEVGDYLLHLRVMDPETRSSSQVSAGFRID